jgi:hypothetical protein
LQVRGHDAATWPSTLRPQKASSSLESRTMASSDGPKATLMRLGTFERKAALQRQLLAAIANVVGVTEIYKSSYQYLLSMLMPVN